MHPVPDRCAVKNMQMGTTSGVLWILILKDKFENQMTGRFFPISLSLSSVSFF